MFGGATVSGHTRSIGARNQPRASENELTYTTSHGRQLPADGDPSRPEDRQRQRLILALVLFLAAIGVVIFRVSTTAAVQQPVMEASLPAAVRSAAGAANSTAGAASDATASGNPESAAIATGDVQATGASDPTAPGVEHGKPSHQNQKPSHGEAQRPPATLVAQAPAPAVTRKVLPPLAVEVFAGGRPVPLQSTPTAAVRVDTSGGVQGRATAPGADTSASVPGTTENGRVRISAEALQVLSHPVDPNYPMLAREMKVQGSVILDAFISRDGTIQALKIVSGPTILATAAMEAVRQWRFKPYLQAGQAVETEARITVNFTISTT